MKANIEKRYVKSQPGISTDHLDLSKARRVTFPNLKPSTETISVELPQSMLDEIKVMANKKDVPYQTFIKMILAEKLAKA